MTHSMQDMFDVPATALSCTLDIDEAQQSFPHRDDSTCNLSPLFRRCLLLQKSALDTISQLQPEQISLLRKYYNYALVSRRQVVADVNMELWKSDLATSLAALTFAREQIQAFTIPSSQISIVFGQLISTLIQDIDSPWFNFVTQKARRPTMISMSSLPAVNLGEKEERYFVQSISDSWPSKQVSEVLGNTLKFHPKASRRFVDDMVAGDLGDVEITLSDAEISFINTHSIGWASQYQSALRSVLIIEIDPWALGEIKVDEVSRRAAYKAVKVREQRLDQFSLKMRMHEDQSFQDNLVLERLLAIDQILWPIQETTDSIDIGKYLYVSGSGNEGLGPVDEEVLLKSMGSMTAKNKLRSALSISAKCRLNAYKERGHIIRDLPLNEKVTLKTMMIRCGVDGIYVKTKIPIDSALVLISSVGFSVFGARAILTADGVTSLGEVLSMAFALTIGLGFTFHNIRYKSWSIGETVRCRRMCATDEEMSLSMSKHEMISTIALAGSQGAGMDGIMTSPYSNNNTGKFSVTKPLHLEAASKVGLKLRLSTNLQPLWVDLKGIRRVEQREIWYVQGEYLEKSYLDLTSAGPDTIG